MCNYLKIINHLSGFTTDRTTLEYTRWRAISILPPPKPCRRWVPTRLYGKATKGSPITKINNNIYNNTFIKKKKRTLTLVKVALTT